MTDFQRVHKSSQIQALFSRVGGVNRTLASTYLAGIVLSARRSPTLVKRRLHPNDKRSITVYKLVIAMGLL